METTLFEFAVLYGRRRVGKTTLIGEFCKDKKTFFVATEAAESEKLLHFSKCVFKTMINSTAGASFSCFSRQLDYIDGVCTEERIVLLIDEYPYLAESYKPHFIHDAGTY